MDQQIVEFLCMQLVFVVFEFFEYFGGKVQLYCCFVVGFGIRWVQLGVWVVDDGKGQGQCFGVGQFWIGFLMIEVCQIVIVYDFSDQVGKVFFEFYVGGVVIGYIEGF